MYVYYIHVYVHVILFSKSEIGNSSGAGCFGWYTLVFLCCGEKKTVSSIWDQKGGCGGFSEQASHCGCYQSRLWNMNGAKVRAWLWHQQANKGWMLSPNPMLLEPSCAQPGSRVLAFISVLKHFGKCGCLAPPGTYQKWRLIAPHRFGELGVWGRTQSLVLTSSGGGLLQLKFKPSMCHLLQEPFQTTGGAGTVFCWCSHVLQASVEKDL